MQSALAVAIVVLAGAVCAAVVAAAALVGPGGGADDAAGPRDLAWKRTAAPANGLSGLHAVRIGPRVVVVGGADYDQTAVKALVLDARSGRWSRAARSGLPWRAGHSVVAAGGRAIVWGGARRSAAAYDPARDRWRRIPPGPLARRNRHAAVWIGTRMIVWGGWQGGRVRRDGAAYDPGARRWRPIAPGPLSARLDHAAVWTGREMIVWGGARPAPDGRALVLSDGAAYDPERDAWRRIAPAPIASAPAPVLGQGLEVGLDAVWTGRRAIVWNGLAGAAYAPRADRWTRLPPPPPLLRHWKPTDAAVWTGRRLIAFGGTAHDSSSDFIADAAAYDPARRRWEMLPPAPIAGRDRLAAAWTGDAMLVFGGCCRGSRHHHDGALYRPR
jgi:hypothetical protein